MERSKTLLYLPNGSSDQRPVNNLIAHEQIEKSVHLVQLTHDFGESDHIFFSRGLMPREIGCLQMNTQAAWKPGSGKATSSANSVTKICVSLPMVRAAAKKHPNA